MSKRYYEGISTLPFWGSNSESKVSAKDAKWSFIATAIWISSDIVIQSKINYFKGICVFFRPNSNESSFTLFLRSDRYMVSKFWKYFSFYFLTFLLNLFRFWLFSCLEIFPFRNNLKYLELSFRKHNYSRVNQGLFVPSYFYFFFFLGGETLTVSGVN